VVEVVRLQIYLLVATEVVAVVVALDILADQAAQWILRLRQFHIHITEHRELLEQQLLVVLADQEVAALAEDKAQMDRVVLREIRALLAELAEQEDIMLSAIH